MTSRSSCEKLESHWFKRSKKLRYYGAFLSMDFVPRSRFVERRDGGISHELEFTNFVVAAAVRRRDGEGQRGRDPLAFRLFVALFDYDVLIWVWIVSRSE